MKWIVRIATFLFLTSSVLLATPLNHPKNDGEKVRKVKKTKMVTNFTGYRIDPQPVDVLLTTEITVVDAEEFHLQEEAKPEPIAFHKEQEPEKECVKTKVTPCGKKKITEKNCQ